MNLLHHGVICLIVTGSIPGALGRALITSSQHTTTPKAQAISNDSNFTTSTNDVTILSGISGTPGIAILDYGYVVEGIPAFEVLRICGDTSVLEITYSETRAALDIYMGDGPLPLAAAMDTYRVNIYNVTRLGAVTNRLIQGTFRYQKLNLSSAGELTLRNIGVRPTVNTTPIPDLPGSFETSNEDLNRIWAVGARTIQLTEIPKYTIPDFWEVTPEGSLVDSLAPQVLASAAASQLLMYEIDFRVQPVVGGFGFTVLSDTLNSGIYFSCDIVSRNVTAYAGSTTQNQVLESPQLPLNLTFAPGSWHSVHATIAITEISVSIDGQPVLSMSQRVRFFGSFGLGASLGHRALFQNLTATIPTGEVVYSHSLTENSFLPDFFMGANPSAAVVDGSRRDRIAYAGDLDVAGGAALRSTNGLEFIIGSLDLLGSYQTTPGFFIPTAKIQQAPLSAPLAVNITGLIGYSFNFLTAVAQTYQHTGDTTFAELWAPKITKMLDWANSQILESGLFNLSDITFGGDWNYYDPPQAGIVTKFNMLYAYSLQECISLLGGAGVNTAIYQERLSNLRIAIDTQLWSDELGAYYFSEAIQDGFGQDSNALAILAGVNLNFSHSSSSILSTLSNLLMQPTGPLAFSSRVLAAGFQAYISPYASSYHLRAALTASNDTAALELLHNLWVPMANPSNENYTGTFWETLDASGSPGLGLVTSLCHGWAAGPTAELSKYVLGALPSAPGWKEWTLAPRILELMSAKGKVPTPSGTIFVDWEFDADGMWALHIESPKGLKGIVSLPNTLRTPVEESVFTVNGEVVGSTTFEVVGGSAFTLTQARKTYQNT
ncbi:glycoside hydrolase family 78 protein [Bisporella sp. PMI_857]|nr:glycoside hydrolase family 78 protein [Bisporella sp. PMI_857]